MKRHFPIKLGQLNQEESGSYHFLTLYLIPYISAEKYGNEPESQKWNGKFGRTGSSAIARGLHTPVHLCIVAWQVG